MADDLVLYVKYPWQQVLLDAFMEFDPERLPTKISAAQRVIAERLSEIDPLDLNERLALKDAMRSLRVLVVPQQRQKPFSRVAYL